MKKLLMTAGLLGSALMASAALAQATPPAAPQPSSAPSNFMTRLEPGQMLASKIMDEDVVGSDNRDIGDVEDLVLDRNGQVVAVVVEVEEGLGDRTVALPMSAIQMNAADAAATTGSVQGSGQTGGTSAARASDDIRIMVNMPVDQLKSAPEFDEND